MSNPESREPSPDVIMLTENREVLAKKIEEYKGRLTDGKERSAYEKRHIEARILIGEKILSEGQVSKESILAELTQRFEGVDPNFFENDWIVIGEYVRTGGVTVIGGTGLDGKRKGFVDDSFFEKKAEADDDNGGDNGNGSGQIA
jgi:hypothetical protein